MTALEPHLLVRAAVVYVAAIATLAACLLARPAPRAWAGALLATAWNLPVLLLVNVAAIRLGWWRFEAEGGLLLGIPVDLYLVWAWLWGIAPLLVPARVPAAAIVLIALAFDVALMPAASPVLQLGTGWLAGEALALAAGLVPGVLLARWTERGDRLIGRALLQVGAFSGLLLVVLPAIAIDGSGTAWLNPLDRPAWHAALLAQLIAVPAVMGLSAVQEFVTRGGGTPVPFDPPVRLVSSGIYAYVRNPMQLAAMLVLVMLGAALQNAWVAGAAIIAHLYSAGLAGWDEDEDLRRRFGEAWTAYRRGVRSWLPRWRPWVPPDRQPSRLYVAVSCDMCSEVGGWFTRRDARGLILLPAESHPSGGLTRITYEAPDGARASGIEAVARALEHTHLVWALAGCAMRLPIVRPTLQLLVDASGGEARLVRESPWHPASFRDRPS